MVPGAVRGAGRCCGPKEAEERSAQHSDGRELSSPRFVAHRSQTSSCQSTHGDSFQTNTWL